jgi:hypothetical protein
LILCSFLIFPGLAPYLVVKERWITKWKCMVSAFPQPLLSELVTEKKPCRIACFMPTWCGKWFSVTDAHCKTWLEICSLLTDMLIAIFIENGSPTDAHFQMLIAKLDLKFVLYWLMLLAIFIESGSLWLMLIAKLDFKVVLNWLMLIASLIRNGSLWLIFPIMPTWWKMVLRGWCSCRNFDKKWFSLIDAYANFDWKWGSLTDLLIPKFDPKWFFAPDAHVNFDREWFSVTEAYSQLDRKWFSTTDALGMS